MIINGTLQNSIYPQSLVNWAATVVPQSNTGYFNLIFSGSGNETLFSLSGGQILSPNNNLIGGYSSLQSLNFSGNLGPATIDLYQNGNPLYLGMSRSTQGVISGIVLQSSTNSGIDFKSLTILGSYPAAQPSSGLSLVLYPNQPIAFPITNTGAYGFNILSGSTSNANFYISGATNLIVPPSGGTGIIYIVSSGSSINYSAQTVPIQLYTDHGTQSFSPVISGSPTVNKQYSLYFYVSDGVVTNSVPEIYNVSINNPDGAVIGIGLRYVSGVTGNYYSLISTGNNIYNVPVSGNITGSGYLYGYNTGQISGFNTGSSQYEYGTGSGLNSLFVIASDGLTSGNFLVTGYGLGSTTLYASIPGTGSISNILHSGQIGIRGGYVTGIITGNVSGSGIDPNGGLASGLISNPISIIQVPFTGVLTGNFNSGQYIPTTLTSETLYVTGTFSTIIPMTGYGVATGAFKSGVLAGDFAKNFDPGIYTFYTNYSGYIQKTGQYITGFDPIGFKGIVQSISGLLVNQLQTQIRIDTCTIDFTKQQIVPTGVISGYYVQGASGSLVPFVSATIFSTLPSGGREFQFENSYNTGLSNASGLSLFGYPLPRTNISRPGRTASGSGYFSNVFQPPFSGGQPDISGNPMGWSEYLTPIITNSIYIGTTPILSYISGNFGLMNTIAVGGTSGVDFAEIDISLSGTGTLFPVNLNLTSQTERTMLFVSIYSGNSTGTLAQIQGGYYYSNGCSSCGINSTNIQYFYPSGNYKIIISGQQLPAAYLNSFCGLDSSYYIGYKQNGLLSFSVIRTGYLNFPISGLITAKLDATKYLPYGLSSDFIANGLTWNLQMGAGQSVATYGFYLYPDAAYQQSWGGNISLQVYPSTCFCTDLFTLPALTNGSQSASFTVVDNEGSMQDISTVIIPPNTPNGGLPETFSGYYSPIVIIPSPTLPPYNNPPLPFQPTPTPAPTPTPPPTSCGVGYTYVDGFGCIYVGFPINIPHPSPSPSPSPTPHNCSDGPPFGNTFTLTNVGGGVSVSWSAAQGPNGWTYTPSSTTAGVDIYPYFNDHATLFPFTVKCSNG